MEEEKTVIEEFTDYAKEYLPHNEEAFESAVYDRIYDILNDKDTRRNAGFLGYEVSTTTTATNFFEDFKAEIFEQLELLEAKFSEAEEDLIAEAIDKAAVSYTPSPEFD